MLATCGTWIETYTINSLFPVNLVSPAHPAVNQTKLNKIKLEP